MSRYGVSCFVHGGAKWRFIKATLNRIKVFMFLLFKKKLLFFSFHVSLISLNYILFLQYTKATFKPMQKNWDLEIFTGDSHKTKRLMWELWSHHRRHSLFLQRNIISRQGNPSSTPPVLIEWASHGDAEFIVISYALHGFFFLSVINCNILPRSPNSYAI